jgi:hypothetical protein
MTGLYNGKLDNRITITKKEKFKKDDPIAKKGNFSKRM